MITCLLSLHVQLIELGQAQPVSEPGIPQGAALDAVAGQEGLLLGGDSRAQEQRGERGGEVPVAGGQDHRDGRS